MNGVTDRPTLKSSSFLRHMLNLIEANLLTVVAVVAYHMFRYTLSQLYFLLLLFLLHRSSRSWCHPHFHLNQVSEGLIHQDHRNSPSIRLVGPCLGIGSIVCMKE